jgi:4'-phosphopantetheinyl transferase
VLATGAESASTSKKFAVTILTPPPSPNDFSLQRERAGLRALPDHLRVAAFYACWTRKESFLKATGDGLSFPLAGFSVTTHPDQNPAIEEIRGDTQSPKQWVLKDLNVFYGYRTAVAIDRSLSHVQTLVWN